MNENYYAILELAPTADDAAIKASYRRLAKLRHPDKNPYNPGATAQFQILSVAYKTLIDPQKRREYDSSVRPARQSPCNPDGSSSSKPTYSGNREARPNTASYTDDDEGRRVKRKIKELEKELESLRKTRFSLEAHLLEARHRLAGVQEALDRLQAEEDKDAQEEAAKRTWFASLFRARESEEAKEARERRTTGRRTGRIVRETERDSCTRKINTLTSQLQRLRMHISSVQHDKRLEEQQEERRQDILAKERREATQRKAEDDMERARQKARDDAVKSQKERQAREAQVRRDRAQEAQKQKQQGPKAKPNQPRSQPQAAGQAKTEACVHRGWWTQVEGRHRCHRCLQTTARFAFECPHCSKIACAGCRNILRDMALR
ncbi:DnaJ domain-containing protein [Diaporthe sp. PMI_573]|nr:DnaJ domain-containing protein [Diaporthaceae sp. PMI_573]